MSMQGVAKRRQPTGNPLVANRKSSFRPPQGIVAVRSCKFGAESCHNEWVDRKLRSEAHSILGVLHSAVVMSRERGGYGVAVFVDGRREMTE